MNKITNVNLRGKAFQLEEAAYENLQKYLKQAEAKLADNPDKKEITSDLEQAIADKCSARLSSAKDVVTAAEMNDVLDEMGVVEDDSEATGKQSGSPESTKANSDTDAGTNTSQKRLYNIPDGALIAGVCNGLAVYFNIEVTLVRLVFLALTILTGGGAIFAYIVLALVIPEAKSKEQVAQAQGRPLNAQDIIENSRTRLHDINDQVQKSKSAKKIMRLGLMVIAVAFILMLVFAMFNFLNVVVGPLRG